MDGDEITPKRVRHTIAEYDLAVTQFARLAGIPAGSLSDVIHEHREMGPGMRARLEIAIRRIEANPPRRAPKRARAS